MSCKFTTILIPPILGLAWAIDLWLSADARATGTRALARDRLGRDGSLRTVVPGMLGFVLAMVAANLVVTGFSTIPLSANDGSHPLLEGRFSPGRPATGRAGSSRPSFPRDWVGFATQIVHQRNGGPSYLLGERRMTGWWYYYPVTLAVQGPARLLVPGRGPGRVVGERARRPGDRAGSSR